jgi:hypothetical protein
MASNFKALPEENMRGAPENRDMPLPLLDLSDAAVKELIRSAKKCGYVTVDQINSVLPSKEANPVQIKEILSIFKEMSWASGACGRTLHGIGPIGRRLRVMSRAPRRRAAIRFSACSTSWSTSEFERATCGSTCDLRSAGSPACTDGPPRK